MKLLALTLALLTAAPLHAAEKVTVALDWTPNTNHVGLYVAEKEGYYAEAGLDVEILPYSDTSAGTLVANRIADFGVVSEIGLLTQHAAGADLVATFAVVQHETGRIVFNADRDDIKTPADLDGKIYAGFGSDWENALLTTVIRNAGGTGEFETVTLGTSAYDALASGKVDFTMDILTWEGVQAELLGQKQRNFRFSDYGIPDVYTTMLGASAAWLDAHPEAARAFLRATQRGYAFAAEHPKEAADILIEATDGMLSNPALVHASMQALVEGHYLKSEEGAVGQVDPARVEDVGAFLFKAGILKDQDGEPLQTQPDFTSWIRTDGLTD